jgi:hypothetical protein
VSWPSRFDRTLSIILMVRATFDPEHAGGDTGRQAYQDAQWAATMDPQFAEWFREHSSFVAIASEADHRGLLAGTGTTATEEEVREAVTRLREALYLMTSLAAHFVKLYGAAVHSRPADILDELVRKLREADPAATAGDE